MTSTWWKNDATEVHYHSELRNEKGNTLGMQKIYGFSLVDPISINRASNPCVKIMTLYLSLGQYKTS